MTRIQNTVTFIRQQLQNTHKLMQSHICNTFIQIIFYKFMIFTVFQTTLVIGASDFS